MPDEKSQSKRPEPSVNRLSYQSHKIILSAAVSTPPASGVSLVVWYASTQRKGGYVDRTSQNPKSTPLQPRVRRLAHPSQLLQRGIARLLLQAVRPVIMARGRARIAPKAPTAAGGRQMKLPWRPRVTVFSSLHPREAATFSHRAASIHIASPYPIHRHYPHLRFYEGVGQA